MRIKIVCGTTSRDEKSSCCMSQAIRVGKHRRELWLKPHPNFISETDPECEHGPKCLRAAEERNGVGLGIRETGQSRTISTWGFFGHFFCYGKHIGVTRGACLKLLRHGGAFSSPLTFKPLLAFWNKMIKFSRSNLCRFIDNTLSLA
jgi:hypothetical protein